MKHSKSSRKKHATRKKKTHTTDRQASGVPVISPVSSPLATMDINSADYSSDSADGELNLSPLGTSQAGFGEFIDDEWEMDEDVKNDFIRPVDIGSDGKKPNKKKDFLKDGDR